VKPAQAAPPEQPSPQPQSAPLPTPKLAPDEPVKPDAPISEPPPPAPRPRLSKPRSILTSLGREAICPQYLSEVRGIGEVYEKKLYAAGIGTFWELAHTSDEELERIFDAKDFQDVNCQVIRDDAMRLAIETGALGREWDGSQPDNLTEISGIGRTFEKRLFDAGVCTFEALARLSPARLEEICGSGGLRRPNYSEWIAEARARA
jgi:predicted flap endonuclease-1-like 5' DNA nuclease